MDVTFEKYPNEPTVLEIHEEPEVQPGLRAFTLSLSPSRQLLKQKPSKSRLPQPRPLRNTNTKPKTAAPPPPPVFPEYYVFEEEQTSRQTRSTPGKENVYPSRTQSTRAIPAQTRASPVRTPPRNPAPQRKPPKTVSKSPTRSPAKSPPKSPVKSPPKSPALNKTQTYGNGKDNMWETIVKDKKLNITGERLSKRNLPPVPDPANLSYQAPPGYDHARLNDVIILKGIMVVNGIRSYGTFIGYVKAP